MYKDRRTSGVVGSFMWIFKPMQYYIEISKVFLWGDGEGPMNSLWASSYDSPGAP